MLTFKKRVMLMWISRGFLDWATTAADKSAGGSEEVAMGGTPNSDRWQRQAKVKNGTRPHRAL